MTVLLVTTLLAEDVSLRCQCPLRTGLSLWSLADAALQREIESQRGEYGSDDYDDDTHPVTEVFHCGLQHYQKGNF